MAKKKREEPKQKATTESDAQGRVTLPPYSLTERQYLGFTVGVVGCVVLLGSFVQTAVPSDYLMWLGFGIVLVALFFHETRPIQRRGWGDVTDEFRSSMKAMDEAENKKRE